MEIVKTVGLSDEPQLVNQVDQGAYLLVRETIEKKDVKVEKDGRKVPISFSFWVRQFKTAAALIAALNGEQLLSAYNKYATAQARIRANSKLPKEETEAETNAVLLQMFLDGDTELLSQEDASNFIPGEREENDVASLVAKAKLCKANKDIEGYNRYATLARAKIAQLSGGLD